MHLTETGARVARRRASYINDSLLPAVTDEVLRELSATRRPYTVVVRKPVTAARTGSHRPTLVRCGEAARSIVLLRRQESV